MDFGSGGEVLKPWFWVWGLVLGLKLRFWGGRCLTVSRAVIRLSGVGAQGAHPPFPLCGRLHMCDRKLYLHQQELTRSMSMCPQDFADVEADPMSMAAIILRIANSSFCLCIV